MNLWRRDIKGDFVPDCLCNYCKTVRASLKALFEPEDMEKVQKHMTRSRSAKRTDTTDHTSEGMGPF